jgi:hypothetical protein
MVNPEKVGVPVLIARLSKVASAPVRAPMRARNLPVLRRFIFKS